VPGDRVDLFEKAWSRQADALIFDLEDSVLANRKDDARAFVLDHLAGQPPDSRKRAWVRINRTPPFFERDLAMISELSLVGIVLPKATTRDEVEARYLGLETAVQVIPLIESSLGLLNAESISRAPGVVRLGLGLADLAHELGVEISPLSDHWAPVFLKVVLASAAGGLEKPLAPAHLLPSDNPGLQISSARLRSMGFGGRTAIHPSQVALINKVFTKHLDEIESARELLAEAARQALAGKSVFLDSDGRVIDAAIVRRARQTVEEFELDSNQFHTAELYGGQD
jgi:citrate lyase subunit beta/citryl-CoA lyase